MEIRRRVTSHEFSEKYDPFLKRLNRIRLPLPENPELRQAVLDFPRGARIPLEDESERKAFFKKYFFAFRVETKGLKTTSGKAVSARETTRFEPKIFKMPPLVRDGALELMKLRESMNAGDAPFDALRDVARGRHSALLNAFRDYNSQGLSFEKAVAKTIDEAARFSEASPLERYVDFLFLKYKPFLEEAKKIFS